MHLTTFVNILPKLRYLRVEINKKWLQELFSTFVFLIDLWKVETSWISGKEENLRKGGVDVEMGGLMKYLVIIKMPFCKLKF